jgi:alpha-tubulin suppressor-like RCC1 family protein
VFAVASIVATMQAGFGSFASFNEATQTVNAADVSLNVTNIAVTGDAGGTALTETITDMIPGDFRERLIQLSANTNFAPAVGITVSGTINNDPTLTTLAGINQVGDSINVLSGTNSGVTAGQPGGNSAAGQGGLYVELYGCTGSWSSAAGVLASSTADRDYTCSMGANGTLLAAYDVPTSGNAPTQWVVPPLTTSQTILVRTRHTNDSTTDGRQNAQQNEQVTLTHQLQGATPSRWLTIGSGRNHTCGVQNNNTLWCWGLGEYGKTGHGSTTDYQDPRQVGTDTDWVFVDAGAHHSCGIKTNGTLWCWGFNVTGAVGQGNWTFQFVSPVQVGTGTDWSRVSTAIGENTCALKTTGTLWCWGSNNAGQLGVGDSTNRNVPTQVGTATDWTQLETNRDRTCGIRNAGQLWCWGENGYGTLGLGDNAWRDAPAAVATGTWTQVSIGQYHACALRTDGTMWCSGYGPLTGVTNCCESSNLFVQVGSATNWNSISVRDWAACGTRTDGSLWCWDPAGTARLHTGTDFVSVNGHYQSVCSLTTSSTLWCAGLNASGQLGLRDNIDRSTMNLVTTAGVGRVSGAA